MAFNFLNLCLLFSPDLRHALREISNVRAAIHLEGKTKQNIHHQRLPRLCDMYDVVDVLCRILTAGFLSPVVLKPKVCDQQYEKWSNVTVM